LLQPRAELAAEESAMAEARSAQVYVRLSLVVPKAGQAAAVAAILDDLLNVYAAQPGYIEGFALDSQLPGGEVGRLTFWRSEQDAEATAGNQHVMAQRAELLRLVEGESHIERSFFATRREAQNLVTPS
jgi:heme-degrading monooxygenase HmoA